LKQELVFRKKFGKSQISYILYFQSAGNAWPSLHKLKLIKLYFHPA